jgi:Dyp-type peroxidase family
LRRLTSEEEVEQFTDSPFKSGAAMTSGLLNDPIDDQGRPIGWKIGGAGNEADVLVIAASDDLEQLKARVDSVHAAIRDVADTHGIAPLILIFDQHGAVLPAPLKGHEHFGFKDGISQPGVRGLVRANPPQFLTERIFDPSVQQNDPQLPEFSRPGQPLVWPGQFVFGYKRQNTHDARNPFIPSQGARPETPAWGRNGSYVVFRRLRQDVKAFRDFIDREAARLQTIFPGMTATELATKLVGRWPSGAPLMRTAVDDTNLAADANADNFFLYAHDSPPAMPLKPGMGHPGDTFPLSQADVDGRRCPVSAHIRKVNSRDGLTEQGSRVDFLTRLVLRRGVPFGEAYDLADPAERDSPDHDRGLIFVSYQTSIQDQFVFLQSNWANDEVNPNIEDSGLPGGQDPLIGQRSDNGRARTFTLKTEGGVREVLTLNQEFVTPTGGGFFFSPSISTILNVLGRAAPLS